MRKYNALIDQHALLSSHPLPDTAGSFVLGLALLLAGRRLFWLFVAGLGFITATEFIAPLVAHNDPVFALIIGLIAGIAGALLAIFLQKVAIGLAGAVAGAYYLNRLLDMGSMHDPRWAWLSMLIGAVLGALFLLFLFKWALIVFSSIVGAHLLLRPFDQLQPGILGAGFIILALGGILFQGRQLRRSET